MDKIVKNVLSGGVFCKFVSAYILRFSDDYLNIN